jgi:hypothetical protein
VRCVERLSGHAFEVDASPGKSYVSEAWVCNTAHARAEYGISVGISLESGIGRLLALASAGKE